MWYCADALSFPSVAYSCNHVFACSGFYCVSPGLVQLAGVPENMPRKVQSVQNAAARLLTNTRRPNHIIPVLLQLHWLPVHRRLEFKIAGLAHQFFTSTTPTYPLVSEHGRRHLHSSPYMTLAATRTCSTFGDRSFVVVV